MVETAKRSNLVLLCRHAQATACGHGCDILRSVFRSDHNLIYCNRAIDFGLLHCPSRFQHTIHHSSASRRRLNEITLQVSFIRNAVMPVEMLDFSIWHKAGGSIVSAVSASSSEAAKHAIQGSPRVRTGVAGTVYQLHQIQAPEIVTIGQLKPEEGGPKTWSMDTSSVLLINGHRNLLLHPAIGVAAVPSRR